MSPVPARAASRCRGGVHGPLGGFEPRLALQPQHGAGVEAPGRVGHDEPSRVVKPIVVSTQQPGTSAANGCAGAEVGAREARRVADHHRRPGG